MKFKHSLLATSAVLAAAAISSSAYAQQASNTIEELVVTAEKREQSLQDVPVAISAFTDEKRDLIGISSVFDLTNFTPGLQYSSQTDRVSLRGVGRTSNVHAADASRPSARPVRGHAISGARSITNSRSRRRPCIAAAARPAVASAPAESGSAAAVASAACTAAEAASAHAAAAPAEAAAAAAAHAARTAAAESTAAASAATASAASIDFLRHEGRQADERAQHCQAMECAAHLTLPCRWPTGSSSHARRARMRSRRP